MGRDFSRDYPVLAPMLSGATADADVERLLEGVAFLTANINRKLDDEFPEILHTLMQMICPHYLRPVPAATLIAFIPNDNLSDVLRIPAGVCIDSVPTDETACRFSTCTDVDIAPLKLTRTSLTEQRTLGVNVDQLEIRLDFELAGMSVSSWNADTLRLHLAGDYQGASELYFLLCHHLRSLSVACGNAATPVRLAPDQLRPGGFGANDALLPYPPNVFPSFRLIQEYFLFPEKFMFLDIDLSQWKNRGSESRFSLSFICSVPPFEIPKIRQEHFILFAVPAVNLFPHDADPVLMDHHENEIPILSAEMGRKTYEIFSVDSVAGFVRGTTQKRDFVPLAEFSPETRDRPVYHTVFRPSTVDGQTDICLAVAYPAGEHLPDAEIITTQLTCTNGKLPDMLQTGDICKPTSNTPELVSFRNIRPPTASQAPPAEGDLLWHLLSHLSVNYLSVASTDTLKSLLQFYQFPGGRDRPRELANRKRIDSLLEVSVTPEERLFGRAVYRGQAIRIKSRHDHYASIGDMYLFGSILDYFLGSYASINTYTSLTFEDVMRGEFIRWPARLGTRPLL